MRGRCAVAVSSITVWMASALARRCRMSQQVSFRTFAGSAAENYERYFVPVIPVPLAADLVQTAALRPGGTRCRRRLRNGRSRPHGRRADRSHRTDGGRGPESRDA
jgi:hypothetical protein